MWYSKTMQSNQARLFFYQLNRKTRHKNSQAGLTLTEVLVVGLILAILIITSLINAPKFIARANDSRRKSDLEAYRIAFERYYDDNKCYPDPSLFTTCRANTMSPYLPFIMCDPQTKQPYRFVRDDCKTFKVFADLHNTSDPDIEKIGCLSGCGPDDDSDGTKDFNYGVSSGNANAGEQANASIPGLCIRGGGKKCFPDVCGACCPGDTYRCDATGMLCTPDTLCQ